MNLKFFRREAPAPQFQNLPPQDSDDSNAPQNSGADYGNKAERVRGEEDALKVAAFYRAVELRSTTMAMLQWQYQRFDKAGNNYTMMTRGNDAKRLNYLLQVRPNPLMSASDLMKMAEQYRIFHGNAVIYVDRGVDGTIEALWLCNSATLNTTANTYTIAYYGMGGVKSLSGVEADNIIHIRNTFTSEDGLVGVPTLHYASRVLSIAATNDKQTLENSAKGGKLKLLVQEEKTTTFGVNGRASKKELEKLTDQLNEDIYGKDVVLVNNVAGVHPISMNAQQMELANLLKHSTGEIARLMGVPLPMLQDYSNSSYKTPEASTQEFLNRTIAPIIRLWEDEFNAKLLSASSYGTLRYHLCELPLMRMDLKQQAEIDKLHLETGVKTVNELRAGYDLPAVQNGDIHYISTNLAEIGSKKLSGETTPAPSEPSKQSEPSEPKKEEEGGDE